MKKRVLITGVNGFIGQACWDYIQKNHLDWEVFGLDVSIHSPAKNLFSCNLNYQKRIRNILINIQPDYIFHFAGGRMSDEKKLMESNFWTTKKLLDAIKVTPNFKPRVIIPGSAAEYGKTSSNIDITEKHQTKPVSMYGLSKLMQTQLGLTYARNGLDISIARIFNISGKNTPEALVAGKFATQIVNIERGLVDKIIHTKDLSGKRDFLDVEDVCRQVILVAQYGSSGQIYNICSNKGVRIKNILKQLLSLSNVPNIVIKEDKLNFSHSFDTVGSNKRIKSLGKSILKISLRQSLLSTLKSYRSRK